MVAAARRLGVRFQWVIADGGYGKDPKFLRGLDAQGELFMVDVHQDQHIYLDDPKPRVPVSKHGRGRKRSRLRAQVEPMRVDGWLESQPDSAWHSVSNAPADTSMPRLVSAQGQRFWIERSFQDGQSHVGLDHYQARGWKAWHHHVALVMMAMLFMLRERVQHRQEIPLLSCADIEILLAQFLPRRDHDADEVIRQMELRHRKRRISINSAYAKQQLAGSIPSLGNVTK